MCVLDVSQVSSGHYTGTECKEPHPVSQTAVGLMRETTFFILPHSYVGKL